MKKSDLIYLKHMLDASRLIDEFLLDINYGHFLENKMVQAAVIREIEIIGEASKNVTSELKTEHSDIPWKLISGMRNKLIHNYFGVDLDAVWETAVHDIPDLGQKLTAIIQTLESE